MYFSFGKSYNKLLDVKCITLNSPLISRMNSIKLLNDARKISRLDALGLNDLEGLKKGKQRIEGDQGWPMIKLVSLFKI